MPKLLLAGLGLALLTACGPKADRPTPATDSPPAPSPQAAESVPAPATVTPARPDTARTTPAPHPVTQSSPAPASEPARKPAPKPAAAVPGPEPATLPTPTAPAPAAAEPVPTAAAPADPWHPAARDTLDFETYQGWKQFELNCSRCHGEYAVGTSFAPALVVSLKEGGTIPTKEMFITTVCAGRLDKGMPSWCALGLEMGKIEQIYQYVKGRADGLISAGRPAQRP
jgi:mono/diheme cytochrome c family protein